MRITPDHTIITATDNEAAAAFFAKVMGLPYDGPQRHRIVHDGPERHFAPVQVSETFHINFMTVDNPTGIHLAFDVDPATFDQVLARLEELGVAYGSRPDQPANGRTDHPLKPRGLYFADDNRNLYEVTTAA